MNFQNRNNFVGAAAFEFQNFAVDSKINLGGFSDNNTREAKMSRRCRQRL
jgi:hypothetical protein